MRRKKRDDTIQDSGLLYAGTPTDTIKPAEPGDTIHTYNTDRGPLILRENALSLETDEGDITIPYHTIEAWDDGKKFHIWWNDNGRDYTMACTPTARGIGAELQNMIHKKTFG